MQGQGRAEGWCQPKSPGCLTGHLEGKEVGKTGRVGGAGLGHESRGAINQNEEVGEESCFWEVWTRGKSSKSCWDWGDSGTSRWKYLKNTWK